MIRAKVQAECASTVKTTLVGWRELNSSNPWSGAGSPASVLEPHGPLCYRAQMQEECQALLGAVLKPGTPFCCVAQYDTSLNQSLSSDVPEGGMAPPQNCPVSNTTPWHHTALFSLRIFFSLDRGSFWK